ncbi:MAG: phage shock protein E [Pseudoalteromonas tetraodonis]|jgi:phage shock protein E
MKTIATLSLLGLAATWFALAESETIPIAKSTGKACDSARFLTVAVEAEELRSQRRLTEAEFAKAAADPDTIVLDARGSEFYERRHVLGAVNLPYTHFGAANLGLAIPSPSTRVLIYCRNNLRGAAFPGTPTFPVATEIRIVGGKEFEYPAEYDPPEIPKSFVAGLNIPTYITLHSYGYDNVWELDDVVDPDDSPIQFARNRPPPPLRAATTGAGNQTRIAVDQGSASTLTLPHRRKPAPSRR